MASHLFGALISKTAPVALQLVLLTYVSRSSGVSQGGALALASATAFLCGSFGEAGFGTSLSRPSVYYGVDELPLRDTRAARIATATAGSVLYISLWIVGLGNHEPALLLAVPLPAILAMSYGYGGALNALGLLRREGKIVVAESLAAIALVALFAGALSFSALEASLAGLVGGRALGLLARTSAVSTLGGDVRTSTGSLISTQASFTATTTATVVQGQADILILGFFGSFALLGVYAPLVRIAYGFLLVAEALSWALYGAVGDAAESPASASKVLHRWKMKSLLLGFGFAGIFLLAYRPILEMVTGAELTGLWIAALALAVVIPIRFGSFIQGVELIRSGRQLARVVPLMLAAFVLAAGALVGARLASISILGLSRLASEIVVAVGYTLLTLRAVETHSLMRGGRVK